MATPGGTITEKDIIEKEAYAFGPKLVAEFKKIIKIQNEANASVIEYGKNLNTLRKVENGAQFISEKQKEILAFNQARNAIELTKRELIGLEKAVQEAIKTDKLKAQSEAQKQNATKKSTVLTIEERVQNEINNKVLKQEALERLGLVTAYTKLNKARTDAKNNLRDLIASEIASTAEIKKAQKEFELLDGKVRKADSAVGDFTKNVGNYPLKDLADGLKDLIGAFGIAGGIGAFAGIMKGAYQTFKEFEQGLADLSAITGASGEDLSFLKNQAIELGKSTKGGAIAVVEAYKLIGSAKPELLSNVAALNQVTEATLLLSKASGLELPDAATKLTDAMNQFGAPAEEASKYIDVLAAGAKYGAAEIPQLAEAILQFGAVAKTSNVDIKESTALVELLAEKGQKGAEAGTKIRNILLQVMSGGNTAEARKELDKYSISIDNLKDKSIPFSQKLESLKPLLKDVASVTQVFGKENATAAISLIENTDRLKELTQQVGEYGVAEEQAAIKTNTLQGKTDRLVSTYDSLVLSLSKGSGVVSGFFKFFVVGATGALESLIRLNTSFEQLKLQGQQDGNARGKKEAQKYIDNSVTNNVSSKDLVENLQIKENSLGWDIEAEKDKLKELNKELAEAKKLFSLFVDRKEVGEAQDKIEKQIEYVAYLEAQNQVIKDKIVLLKNPELKKEGQNDNTATESDSDRKSRLAKRKKANQDKLDLEKQLNNSSYELQRQRLEQTIRFNDEIVSDDSKSDEMRIQALYNSQKKQEDLLILNKNHLLDNDKLTANDRIRINEDYSNKIVELHNKTQKEIDKINLFDESSYQKSLEDKISKNNVAMNNELAMENERFNKLGDLEKLNQKDREDAIEQHEKTILEIKKKFAIEALKLQISNLETELIASDALPPKEQLTADKRQKIAETLSRAKLELTEVESNNNNAKGEEYINKEREIAEQVLQLSSQLTGALSDLGNALFQGKIQKIDDEITKNNEYYDRQIDLAGKDERKKDLLQKERDQKNLILEKKKREEQRKQAIFNKGVQATQVIMATSLAVISALAQVPKFDFGISAATIAGVYAGIGAIQLAAVLATPIPKYKMGRKDGPAELAEVGDGFVNEIIEKSDGRAYITPNRPTITYLEKGDKVHSSVDEYLKLQKNSLLNGIENQGRKVNDFQNNQMVNINNDSLLLELKENTKAIKNQKNTTIVNVPKIDMAHEFWKMKNKNWN